MVLRKFIYVLILFFFIVSCATRISTPSIQAVEIASLSPLMGSTVNRAYFYDSLIIYEIQYRVDSFTGKLKDSVMMKELKSRQWVSRYFVFHRDSSYGYGYDPNQPLQNNVRLAVDSQMILLKGSNTYDQISVKPDSVIWNNDKTEAREVYVWQQKQEQNLPAGHLEMYYSKSMNHLKESLNAKLDATKGMKLYKIELQYEPYTDSTSRVWPGTRDLTELKEIPLTDSSMILSYFKMYRENVQKSH